MKSFVLKTGMFLIVVTSFTFITLFFPKSPQVFEVVVESDVSESLLTRARFQDFTPVEESLLKEKVRKALGSKPEGRQIKIAPKMEVESAIENLEKDEITKFYENYPEIRKFMGTKQVVVASESSELEYQSILESEGIVLDIDRAYKDLKHNLDTDQDLVKRHIIRGVVADLLKEENFSQRDEILDFAKQLIHGIPGETLHEDKLQIAKNEVNEFWKIIGPVLTPDEKEYLELELAEMKWNESTKF